MGRQALRKVAPGVDLSGHLRTFDQMPRPWNAAALFARLAPLEVEVGTGKGLFLVNESAAKPQHNFLGIELAHRYAQYAAGRLARRGLTNAVVVHADALRVFRELLPPDALEAVHVYFPDPWWKKRHRKRRVMTEGFVADVERVLRPGGLLHFWTDVEDYFDESVALIRRVTRLSGPEGVEEHQAQHDLDYRTNFERRKRKDGLTIHRSIFRKNA